MYSNLDITITFISRKHNHSKTFYDIHYLGFCDTKLVFRKTKTNKLVYDFCFPKENFEFFCKRLAHY